MDYDVIIVGARVAGSALAALLGQHGHRVLLLDKAQFPSDTLSTHFFRAPALRVFERLGVLEEVKSAAPPMTVMWNYIDGHVVSDPVEAHEEHLRYFLCERRITLDWILFQHAAREPNVEIRQGAQVRELIQFDGRVAGVRWSEAGGMNEATARVVVGADGIYSTLAKILGPAFESQFPVRRCMYYTYFQGIEPLDEAAFAEHHFVGDTLTYVFPTDAHLTLVAVSAPISEFASFKKEPLKRLCAHLASLPLLAPRLSKAEIVAEVKGAGNIPCYQRVPYGHGWALVGDAHQIMDPWSGMGIDHAATHASILADSLHRFLTDAASWDVTMSDYHAQARRWSEKTYRRTSTYAADLRPMTHAALQKRGLV
ncbi:MAG: NAD(P)/FAD-dependent oxidoreductase [Anaerolineales bacterium]|nr:NAD(P)/FAD-dependent oxidoreductase [Anaerolineales bacterium]NUQ85257.1 NAD(P)/FAD-dependent oxidoreductase [Anaerolineales bacterium]